MSAGCHIASCRPLIEPPSHHLVMPAGCCIHCTALSLSCCASCLSHCLSPFSHCDTLVSTHHASLLLHCLSLSSCCAPCHPLILSLRRLVVALPLDALPSCRLVISSCRLVLSRRASWLLRHHLLSSSCCTAVSSSHRAGWFLHCLSLCCSLVLLLYSIADAIERCQTPLPPPGQ